MFITNFLYSLFNDIYIFIFHIFVYINIHYFSFLFEALAKHKAGADHRDVQVQLFGQLPSLLLCQGLGHAIAFHGRVGLIRVPILLAPDLSALLLRRDIDSTRMSAHLIFALALLRHTVTSRRGHSVYSVYLQVDEKAYFPLLLHVFGRLLRILAAPWPLQSMPPAGRWPRCSR